jgi:ApaG protein
VVGKQPVLKSGEAFEYQSYCPLNTSLGSMEGEFQMLLLGTDQEVLDHFSAKIGRFALKADGNVTD